MFNFFKKNHFCDKKNSSKIKIENASFPVGLNAFVDLSHHDAQVDLKVAQQNNLLGFIHKATQGISFEDNLYGKRINEGRSLNLLLGAYHFGTAQPVEQQITHFLNVINQYGSEYIVPCLDWEPNPIQSQGTMSLKQAEQFITLFFKKTGIYPMLYGGYWLLLQLKNQRTPEPFGLCPLWQGFYSSHFGFLSDIWSDWTMLQYTDGTHGPLPHEFPGIGKVDRDTFNGNQAQAHAFWKTHSLKQAIQ